MTPLTWLYVPADRADRVPKALASGAHCVIVDLEDGVAADAKIAARDGLQALFPASVPVLVRVNALNTPWAEADLQAVSGLPVDGIVLPKTESPGDLGAVPGDLPVHCLIETALGVERAFEIASHQRVAGISLGELDLRAQTGADDKGMDWARSRIVNAAVAAGLPRPPQGVFADVTDLDALAVSCAHGRELGFLGRTAIHPRQLPVIVNASLPSGAEAERARRILTEAESRPEGAFALDGAMVDAPVVAAAQQVVELAEQYGTRKA
jgi:citrate lyase subunit beta/citryl-CoA lyase